MELSEYQQNLDKFFKLKNKYDERLQKEKYKLITNPDLSKKEKKIKFNETAVKCINCKNKGGTIFEINKDYFRITCGNVEKPCNINMEFKRINVELINNKLLRYIEDITNIKEKIIKIKLDYILSFISEEVSIVEFNTIKKELTEIYEKYRETLETYIKIVNNIDNQDEISSKIIERDNKILEIKKHIEKYNNTFNIAEITELIELYSGDLEKVIKDLVSLQYKYYYVFIDDDKHRLVRENYSIKDLEIQKES